MTGPREIGLPLAQHGDAAADAWSLPQIEPSNLVVLWPGDEPPGQRDVLSAFERVIGAELELLEKPPLPDDAGVRWLCAVRVPAIAARVVVWCEPMQALADETIEFLNAGHIRWTIGVETILSRQDPLSEYWTLLRLLGRAAPDSPAILAVNTEAWFTRQELQERLLPELAEPKASLLWINHAIGKTPEEGTAWVYTRGMWRCGLPELEMLEVDHEYARAATAILNSVAELVLETGLPAPGEPYPIGNDLFVTFHPWQEIAPQVSDDSLGGVNSRLDHSGQKLDGVRAVVCGEKPTGTYRTLWTWPRREIERLVRGEATLLKTSRETRRQEQVARATFEEFAAAFASLPREMTLDTPARKAVFLVQAGLAKPEKSSSAARSQESREHVWFEVKRFKAGRVEAVLLNNPATLRHLRRGETLWLDRNLLSDWQVITGEGGFSPDDVKPMRETVARLAVGEGTP